MIASKDELDEMKTEIIKAITPRANETSTRNENIQRNRKCDNGGNIANIDANKSEIGALNKRMEQMKAEIKEAITARATEISQAVANIERAMSNIEFNVTEEKSVIDANKDTIKELNDKVDQMLTRIGNMEQRVIDIQKEKVTEASTKSGHRKVITKPSNFGYIYEGIGTAFVIAITAFSAYYCLKYGGRVERRKVQRTSSGLRLFQ